MLTLPKPIFTTSRNLSIIRVLFGSANPRIKREAGASAIALIIPALPPQL
jgi:hypothetical protein